MKLSELNFKCILDTVEKRKALQEALFAIGGKWNGDDNNIRTDEMMLTLEDCKLYYISDSYAYNYGSNKDAPELTYIEAMTEIAKVKPEQKSGWDEFDIVDEGFSIKPLFNVGTMDYFLDEIYQAINEHKQLKAFGGISYIEPVSGDVSQFVGTTFICWHNGTFFNVMTEGLKLTCRHVLPHQIRFFVQK